MKSRTGHLPLGFDEFSLKICDLAKAAITSGARMGTVVWISLWKSSSCAFPLLESGRRKKEWKFR